jgi:hypothetical protein
MGLLFVANQGAFFFLPSFENRQENLNFYKINEGVVDAKNI